MIINNIFKCMYNYKIKPKRASSRLISALFLFFLILDIFFIYFIFFITYKSCATIRHEKEKARTAKQMHILFRKF